MSSKHLAKGSLEPRRKEGLLRLYSMVFCPYAHRVRLVLNAKKIPHDIVNINLMSIPDWYLKIHVEGKVPALHDGDKVVIESLDICDYLDEKFSDIPLYPAEPAAKVKDKEIVQRIRPVTAAFHKCFVGGDEKSPEEWVKDFIISLQPLENELLARGSTFFGGDKPSMIDYMLWPWGEREESIAMRFGVKLSMEDSQLPQLRKWRRAMLEDPVASDIYIGPEIFWKVAQLKLKNIEHDYDSILA